MANSQEAIAKQDKSSSKRIGNEDIAFQALGIELQLQDNDIPMLLDKATRLPIAEIATLGTAFASVPETFRTVTQAVAPAADNLYGLSALRARRAHSRQIKNAATAGKTKERSLAYRMLYTKA